MTLQRFSSNFLGMRIFITGVRRGIGRELAKLALAQGHEVWGTTRNAAVDLNHPAFHHVQLDLNSADSFSHFEEKLGSMENLDVLVNNAGVLLDEKFRFENLPAKALLDTFQVNVVGPHLVTQALLPFLRKSSRPVVASISSIMGSISDNSSGRYYAYRMSKAALNCWNKSFSIDFPGITALVLHPGWVKTDMGGPQATLSVDRSAAGLLKVITTATPEMSGRFFDYRGNELHW